MPGTLVSENYPGSTLFIKDFLTLYGSGKRLETTVYHDFLSHFSGRITNSTACITYMHVIDVGITAQVKQGSNKLAIL